MSRYSQSEDEEYKAELRRTGQPKNELSPQVFITLTECERRIAEAVASEREACAKIADSVSFEWEGEKQELFVTRAGIATASEIAAAIRARGEVKC